MEQNFHNSFASNDSKNSSSRILKLKLTLSFPSMNQISRIIFLRVSRFFLRLNEQAFEKWCNYFKLKTFLSDFFTQDARTSKERCCLHCGSSKSAMKSGASGPVLKGAGKRELFHEVWTSRLESRSWPTNLFWQQELELTNITQSFIFLPRPSLTPSSYIQSLDKINNRRNLRINKEHNKDKFIFMLDDATVASNFLSLWNEFSISFNIDWRNHGQSKNNFLIYFLAQNVAKNRK